MIVCKKCGNENLDNFKFCSYCGSILEGKVECGNCSNLISEEYTFCPHCGIKVSEVHATSINTYYAQKKLANLNNILPILTNSIILFFSLIAILAMFGKLSSFNHQIINSNNSIFNYCEASIKGLKKYTLEDFLKQYANEIGLISYKNINFLNLFMVDDPNIKSEANSTLVYLTTLVILAMMILPLVLIALTINDFTKKRVKSRYRIFFLINITLGLTLSILISMMKFKVEFMVIFYIIISSIPLIYDYIIQLISKEKKLNPLKLITVILIIIIFILAHGSVAKYKETTNNYTEDITYGNFVSVIDYLYQDKDINFSVFLTKFNGIFVSEKMQDANVWIIYFSILIPLFMVTSLGFLIIGLFSEIKDHLNMNEDDSQTGTYLWLSALFNILGVAAVIVVIKVCNYFFNEFGFKNLNISISANIIIVAVLSLGLAIYRSIIKHKVYE